jgi:hypothetical protein
MKIRDNEGRFLEGNSITKVMRKNMSIAQKRRFHNEIINFSGGVKGCESITNKPSIC